MRAVSAQWPVTLRQSHQRIARVTTYYDGAATATIPIVDGSITYDAFAPAARRCTIVVPVEYKGVNYSPVRNATAPLAAYGQRILIEAGVRHADGTEEYVSQGFYVITAWSIDVRQGTITVTGSDLWTLLERAPILRNTTSMRLPRDLAQRIEVVVGSLLYPRLLPDPMPGVLPVEDRIIEISNGMPVGRFITAAAAMYLKEGDSRTNALLDLATAWPAQLRVNDAGLLRTEEIPEPPTSSTPVDIELTDANGANPVLVERAANSERDKVYNCVIMTSRSASTGATIATSHRQITSGPYRCQGPYGYHPLITEPRFATSQAELSAMSLKKLMRGMLYSMTETVSIVPNPAIQLDDVAVISSATIPEFKGRVSGITFPLISSGAMTLTVSNEDATQAAAVLRAEDRENTDA